MAVIIVKLRYTRGPYIAKWLSTEIGPGGNVDGSYWARSGEWSLRWVVSRVHNAEENGHWYVTIIDPVIATMFRLRWP